MAKKLFKKHHYDISLEDGIGAHLVSWVTGLMVFFVTLALAVNFGLASMTKNWVTGLSGTLTVEIKPPLEGGSGGQASAAAVKKFNDSVQQILTFLGSNPSVVESRRLTDVEIKKLIEPWLGQGMSLDTMVLPALIDIKLAPNADVPQLQENLKTLEPSATIDSHTDTLDDVKTLVNTISLFVMLLTGVISLLAVVAISGIVRSKLSIHQAEVETLHLIGASDEYIARQFRHHTLKGTLKGAVIGFVCTFITFFVIGMATHTIDTGIFPQLQLLPLQWGILIIAPIAGGSMIAHLTAQATALKELARLP